MHDYRDSLICKEMRALWPDVSDIDQHIAALVAGEVEERGNMDSIMVIGPHALGEHGEHDTLIPVVLGGFVFNYVVYVLMVHPQYMENQWHHLRLARMRYEGRCLARPMQSPYKAMVNFGDFRFRHIIVMPDVDFDTVRYYCKHYLREDGVMIVAQRGSELEAGNLKEIWRKHLKKTKAGYCIECKEDAGADLVVVAFCRKE